jgi:protocatechuate 3,4-dioxygenase beta subunit
LYNSQPIRLKKSRRETMWNKQIVTIVITTIWISLTNAQPDSDLYSAEAVNRTSQARYEFEGKLIFHQDLPVGIIAGTSEHPKLVEVKSIRFESTFGNAWGVTARVGWLPVINATWKLKAELLDEQGQVLRHSRDEEIIFTGKAANSGRTTMQYVDIDMDAMHNQGRRHVAQFRVHLEPLDEQYDVTESADTKAHTLEVFVVEQENKKPVSDASIVVNSSYILDRYRRYQTLYATDSQGRCEIRLTADKLISVSIEVQKHGFASMTQPWSNAGSSSVGWIPLVNLPQRHTFEMVPVSSVGGIVQDKDGNTIEAAEVRFSASLLEPSGRISIRRSVRTDENGQWRVEGVPSEVDRISIGLKHSAYGGDHGHNRYIKGEALLNARAFKHIETLDKGTTVTGKVLDDNGQPIAEATVMLAQRNSSPFFAITDSTGGFRFVCSDDRDTYGEVPTVVVEALGYAPAQKAIDIQLNPEPLEFHLTRGKIIKCRVVDSEGKPVAGAWTVVKPLLPDYQDYGVWLEDTDQQGEFEIPNVPDSDIGLTVGKQGYIAVRDYVLVPSEEEFTIPMKRALTVQGTVTDAQTGKPIPNFEIATVFSVGGRNRTSNPIDFTEGTYELSFNEASQETQQLQVSAVGYEPVNSEDFKIDEGRRVINFQLARASDFDEKTAGQPRKQVSPPGPRRITGVVRDEKGVPVSGAIVSTRPSLGAETVTNAEGEFTLRTRRVSMVGSGSREETTYLLTRHKERNLAAAMELDETANNLDIKLSPGVIFSGKVVDVDGKGIPDADISMTFWISDYGYGTREPTEVDSDGNFEIRAIPLGYRYSVNASNKGYGTQYVSVHTSEAVGDRMELEPLVLAVANLSVSGVVVDVDDKPVANAQVNASGRGQPNRMDIPTDKQGRFRIEGVCSGPLRLWVNVRGERSMYGSLESQGGATNINIVVAERDSSGRPVPKQPPSLVGKSLPDFENIKVDFSPEQVKDKRILICFWDMQQRPSRNCITELAKRTEDLARQNIVVIGVHVTAVEEKAINEWVKKNNIPFPIGMVRGNEQKTRSTWGVRSLPWLILTDKEHIVRVEGFSINDLDERITMLREK